MNFTTADLNDANEGEVQITSLLWQSFGNIDRFSGPISTIKCYEDNTLVRTALEAPGEGRVLVIDGGGSTRCALVGDNLAQLGHDNNWQGIVVYGCIRDSAVINGIEIGIKALGTNPRKSVKKGAGDRDIPLQFGDVTFNPGAWLYADADGVLLSNEKLV